MGRYDDFFEDETPTVTPTEFSPTPTVEPQADAPAAVTPSPEIAPESAENATTEPETAPDVPKTEEQAPQSETQAPADNTSSDTEASSSDTSATSSDTHDTAEVPETEQPETAPVVPSVIAGKQQSTSLKPRYQGDSEFSQMVAEDWFETIKADPRSYQALLYRPSNGTYGVVDPETGIESDAFTEMDNNQRELTYDDPVIVVLRDSNDSREAFAALDDDSNQDGLVDDYLIVSIADKHVPKGSILEWNEETLDGGERRVWWYVNQLYSYGTQHVGTLYYCIPARTFDTTDSGKPL